MESDDEDESELKCVSNLISGQASNSLNPMTDFFKILQNTQSAVSTSPLVPSNYKSEEVSLFNHTF
jgi:hypothetical protein